MTERPIPAIPKPITIQQMNSTSLVSAKNNNVINGVKYSNNIQIVLTTIAVFA
jgi:hypothetical protein